MEVIDVLSIVDILFVAVPESAIAIAITLLICKKDIFKLQRSKLILNLIFALSVIISMIYYIRVKLDHIVLITIVITLTYMATLKFIYRLNKRQGILAGSVCMLAVIIPEIITLPVVHFLSVELKKTMITGKFTLTIPMRFIQILVFLIIYKTGFTLSDSILLKSEWKELSVSQKITIIFLLMLIVLSITFCTNYTDLFFKLNINSESCTLFGLNLKMYFLETVLFMLITLTLINRTKKYEDYKEVLSQSKYEMIEKILISSTKEDLKLYKELIKECEEGEQNENV